VTVFDGWPCHKCYVEFSTLREVNLHEKTCSVPDLLTGLNGTQRERWATHQVAHMTNIVGRLNIKNRALAYEIVDLKARIRYAKKNRAALIGTEDRAGVGKALDLRVKGWRP